MFPVLMFCAQVRRPLPLSVLLGVLLDAHILGIEMPQERLVRTILADYEGWQVRKTNTVYASGRCCVVYMCQCSCTHVILCVV